MAIDYRDPSPPGWEGRTDVHHGIIHLFIPGPTNVPDAVRRAMNVPMQPTS